MEKQGSKWLVEMNPVDVFTDIYQEKEISFYDSVKMDPNDRITEYRIGIQSKGNTMKESGHVEIQSKGNTMKTEILSRRNEM